MADSPQAETQISIDESHPHVQSLNTAGISSQRLNSLVKNSPTPISHPSVSQQNEQNAANATSQLQAQQSAANQTVIPPLNTQGFQQASDLAPIFAQMLQQILTPPVPTDPQLASTQPAPTPQNA